MQMTFPRILTVEAVPVIKGLKVEHGSGGVEYGNRRPLPAALFQLH